MCLPAETSTDKFENLKFHQQTTVEQQQQSEDGALWGLSLLVLQPAVSDSFFSSAANNEADEAHQRTRSTWHQVTQAYDE